MNRDQAREQIKSYLPSYVESVTQKSKGKNMFICPLCNSGSGKNGTGAFSIKDGTSWKCFCCNESGDIFDLIGKLEHLPDYNDQLKRAGELYNITIDPASSTEYHNPARTEQNTHMSIHTSVYTQGKAPEKNEPTDYTDLFLQAHNDIELTDYWKSRGLSREVVDRFNIGYIAEWKHPKAPDKVPTSPRLIIPTSKYSYLARDTRADVPESQRPYSKSKVGSIQIFNKKAIKNAKKPIFIVEGELDALSIIEVGGEAVALGTTTKAKAFIETLKAEKPSQPLIIALDNDEAGKRTANELVEGLKSLDIPCCIINPAGEYKDANEALQKDREALKMAVMEAESIQTEAEQAEKENYLKKSTANYLQEFVDGITNSVDTPYIPTGFNKLDKVLDDGLYEGLYIIGAVSSLGKTTFTLQMADQIAQSGKDVLLFCLEMSRAEMMSKSISRHTVQIVLNEGGNIGNAKTSRGITTGTRYIHYSSAEKDIIKTAISNYGEYANHIYIEQGLGDIGAEKIKETVANHIKYTGNTPVVIVDYLQILAPYDMRASDKQNTDKAVFELKKISRDYKIPVFAISSLNRQSYKDEIKMEAFKESGAIEYSSDVLIGLQFKGAGENSFNITEAKKKDPREIELVILKNRNGKTSDKIAFKYYPMFNYFEEE